MKQKKFKRRKPNKLEQSKMDAHRFGSNMLTIPFILGILWYLKDAIDWIFIQWGFNTVLVLIPLIGIGILESQRDTVENGLWEEVKK